jgi:hypothetical protein
LGGREEGEKHVFLRNEPDWSPLIFERKYQGDRWLRRKCEFFQSGSFGAKIVLRHPKFGALASALLEVGTVLVAMIRSCK